MTTLSEGIHHGVSFSDYLSGANLPSPAVSGSDLANFDSECPAYAHSFWRGNPLRYESGDTAATTFGTATHCLILEGYTQFVSRYAVKPEGLDMRTKDGKAWAADHSGFEIISAADVLRIKQMRINLMAHPDAKRLLTAGGVAETTMIAKDPATGLYLLARPDLFIERAGLLVNLKTARNLAPSDFERQVFSLRYYLSDAFVRYVAKLCGVASPSHAFLVTGNAPPHLGYVAALKQEAAEWGDRQVRGLLDQFAACVESGVWPGYSDGVLEIGLPAWGAKQVQSKIEGIAA